jgi:hypothetical protein
MVSFVTTLVNLHEMAIDCDYPEISSLSVGFVGAFQRANPRKTLSQVPIGY